MKQYEMMVDVEQLSFKSQRIKFDSDWYDIEEDVELFRYTGLNDDDKKEIYEGDIVEVWESLYSDKHSPFMIRIGVVKYGEYEQDRSGGEYNGSQCLGFYVDSILIAYSDREFKEIDKLHHLKTDSLLEYDGIKVLGNIKEDSHLLEK